MSNKKTELAKEIIENNQYLTLATSNSEGNPWASTVAYAFDEKYNFYWVSVPSSQHQKNIKSKNYVSFSIFDSHQGWGEGIGVQIEATVHEVKKAELPFATKLYFTRNYPYGDVIDSFSIGLKQLLKGKAYRFYKAVPKKVWVPDLDADIDKRLEVDLLS